MPPEQPEGVVRRRVGRGGKVAPGTGAGGAWGGAWTVASGAGGWDDNVPQARSAAKSRGVLNLCMRVVLPKALVMGILVGGGDRGLICVKGVARRRWSW